LRDLPTGSSLGRRRNVQAQRGEQSPIDRSGLRHAFAALKSADRVRALVAVDAVDAGMIKPRQYRIVGLAVVVVVTVMMVVGGAVVVMDGTVRDRDVDVNLCVDRADANGRE
jgi:hypothetical protein